MRVASSSWLDSSKTNDQCKRSFVRKIRFAEGEFEMKGPPPVHYNLLANNYWFGCCGLRMEVIPVGGWRFAPACCAAQSVIRRGPGCAVPLHRLPWAAVNLHRRNELHRSNVSAKGNENLHLSGFNWRQANQAARPNWSLNRTLCGSPGLGFKSLAQTRPTAKCRLASTLDRKNGLLCYACSVNTMSVHSIHA